MPLSGQISGSVEFQPKIDDCMYEALTRIKISNVKFHSIKLNNNHSVWPRVSHHILRSWLDKKLIYDGRHLILNELCFFLNYRVVECQKEQSMWQCSYKFC